MKNKGGYAGHLLSRPKPPPVNRYAAPPSGNLGYVYFIGGEDGPVKIGRAVEPCERIRELQTGNPARLYFHAFCDGGRDLERHYHECFAVDRIRGEWFARSPELEREKARLLKIVLKTKRKWRREDD